jgi:hypothetical protein
MGYSRKLDEGESMDDPVTKLQSTADEKVRTWLASATVLDALTMWKFLRILMPHQSSQLSELERDLLKEAKRPAQRPMP